MRIVTCPPLGDLKWRARKDWQRARPGGKEGEAEKGLGGRGERKYGRAEGEGGVRERGVCREG
eukprot:2675187-Rhodomonas_salina.1